MIPTAGRGEGQINGKRMNVLGRQTRNENRTRGPIKKSLTTSLHLIPLVLHLSLNLPPLVDLKGRLHDDRLLIYHKYTKGLYSTRQTIIQQWKNKD